MKKEIYICDRCGKEIQHTIRTSKYIVAFNKLKKTAEIKTMIAEDVDIFQISIFLCRKRMK